MGKLKARIPGGGGGGPAPNKKKSEIGIFKEIYHAVLGLRPSHQALIKLPSQRKAERKIKQAKKEIAIQKKKRK